VNWFAYHSQVSHRIVEHERIVWHVPSPRLKSKGIGWCVLNRGFGTGSCYYHAYPSRRSNLKISWSSSTWPRNRPVDANEAVDGSSRETIKPCTAVHVRRDPSDTYRNFDYIDPSTQGRIRNQSRERANRPVNFRISRPCDNLRRPDWRWFSCRRKNKKNSVSFLQGSSYAPL
jgi:hypothetical protein